MTPDDIATINAYAVIITAVSTIILAIITTFYAIETRKMRIGAKAPMLSIQCDYAPGETDRPRKLFLCNNGPVAQNIALNAEVKMNGGSTTRKQYLYSMAHGERTEIVDNFYEIRDSGGEITVMMKYHDADMKLYRSEIIVDFTQMTADRTITVPESASTEISEIGGVLKELARQR
jgi:hypothetical protein